MGHHHTLCGARIVVTNTCKEKCQNIVISLLSVTEVQMHSPYLKEGPYMTDCVAFCPNAHVMLLLCVYLRERERQRDRESDGCSLLGKVAQWRPGGHGLNPCIPVWHLVK